MMMLRTDAPAETLIIVKARLAHHLQAVTGHAA